MMMSDDKKKKMASVIVGKIGSPQDDAPAPEKDGALQDDSVAMDTAAEEFLSAVEAKSPKAVVEALKSLWQLMDDAEPDNDELPPSLPPQE